MRYKLSIVLQYTVKVYHCNKPGLGERQSCQLPKLYILYTIKVHVYF